jgi:hypothetical protein
MSSINSRIVRMIKEVGKGPCQTCKDWTPPGGYVVLETEDSPRSHPTRCPDCGRGHLCKVYIGIDESRI